MLLHSVPLFIFLLSAGVSGYPQSSNKYLKSRIHGKRSSIPNGFVHDGHPHPDETISLTFTLASHNMTGLETRLYEVSDPRNPMYGQYLSKEEVNDHVRPSEEVADAVMTWLESHGITDPVPTRSSGHVLSMSVPIHLANKMFSTTFAYYLHEETGSRHIQTMEYQLPDHLIECINHIHPTTQFPVIRSRSSKSSVNRRDLKENISVRSETSAPPSSNETYLNIQTIQELYDLPTYLTPQPESILAVMSYGESFNESDLMTYVQTYAPNVKLDMVSIASIYEGSNDENDPALEASIDIEITASLAVGTAVVFYQVGGDVNTLINTANSFMEMDSTIRPNVVTNSYGFIQAEIDYPTASSICNAFMQLSAMGVSILTSSGDSGVAGDGGATCTQFIPTFPASCPYVTAVGATSGIPETAASFSGGGFSNYFSMPSYQSSAVSGYLEGLGSTNSGLYNASGRGYPDISAIGLSYAIVAGQDGQFYGTSISTPLVASIISMLNNLRISNGQSALGFLNPLLYSGGSLAGATNDIYFGNNPGCGTDGFSATFGWDPVTGLGSPNYPALVDALGL